MNPKLHQLSTDNRRNFELTQAMATAVRDALAPYEGKVTLAAAMGVLEIVKIEMLQAHQGDIEGDRTDG